MRNKNESDYDAFWNQFGKVLKEGLYEDFENREKIVEIVRVYSFKHERLITLENYCDEMLENQDNIYYLASDSLKQAQSSPHLEGFKPKGLDVLLMTDPVDAFWMSQMAAFKEKSFVSISRDKYDLSKIGENDEKTTDGPDETDTITTLMKERLGDVVEDVRATKSLVDSPVRLTASEGGFDFNLERILKAQNPDFEVSKKILEINFMI